MAVFDVETGVPKALMDGDVLTSKRTGASSGAATDLLADSDASEVAILGSGNQARTQLEAVCCVRGIRTARVYSPDQDHAERFAAELSGHGKITDNIQAVHSAAEAVRGATSSVPLPLRTHRCLNSKTSNPELT